MDADVASVRPGEELDLGRVAAFLRAQLPGLEGELEVLQFRGGHANLTFLLRFGGGGAGSRELVLRRPPFGRIAPGAHDMVREFKVLSRLWRLYPRAPRAFVLCEDETVIGAKFFVMERRRGLVIRESVPPEVDALPEGRRRAAFALVDAMVELHDVDVAAADLSDLGKPEGFVARQVSGWADRWQRAQKRDVPLFGRIHDKLVAALPESPAPTLVHNDLKLDNVMLDPSDPSRVVAVLDWDMTTLGDPLIDLGTLLGYWGETTDAGARAAVAGVSRSGGFPTRAEIAGRYAERRRVPLERMRWYEAFALWKTAVVLQQIYGRYARGETKDERFAPLGATALGLLDNAAESLGVPIG
jgi:aminoglycoside phosphotransferase (APT) family kinase protein